MVPKPLTIQIAGQSPINQAVEKALEQITTALRQQIQQQETLIQQRQHQIMVFQVIVKHQMEQRMMTQLRAKHLLEQIIKTQLILEQHQEVVEVKELLDARKDRLHPQVVVLPVQVGLKDQHQWIQTP